MGDKQTPDNHLHERGLRSGQTSIQRLCLTLVVCSLLAVGVMRPFVAEVFHISSVSMMPTLDAGERVLVAKFSYRFGIEPGRGDLIVFRNTEKGGEIAIKRVIGLPGDTVALQDGRLVLNGVPHKEPYVNHREKDTTFYGPARVPEAHFFVLGDNRADSLDSRFLGPIPKEDLLGRVILRL